MPRRRKSVRRPLADKLPTSRSKVSNGRRLFVESDVDGRSALARRYRDLCSAFARDLGGVDLLSEAQQQLIRRGATLSVTCERLESQAAAGVAIDLELFGKLCDRLGRALGRLGLKRAPKDITPTLDAYLRIKREEAPA